MAPKTTHHRLRALFLFTLALSPFAWGEPIATISSTVAASFSPDEKALWVFTQGIDGSLMQTTVALAFDIDTFFASYQALGYASHHAFSPDGMRAAIIFKNKRAPGSLEPTYFHVGVFEKGRKEIYLETRAQTEALTALAFSDDSKKLAVLGLADGEIIDLEAKRSIPLQQLSPASHVSFTKDGRFLIAQARYEQRKGFPLNYGFVAIFNTETGAKIARFDGETNNKIAMNQDGTELLTVSKDHRTLLRSIETGALLKTFVGHLDRVKSAQFSPDGLSILTDSVDRTAMIWDLRNGNSMTTLCGTIQNPLSTAQFSNEGKHVVVSMERNLVNVWDLSKDSYVALMKGLSKQVTSVIQIPDNKTVGIISSLDYVSQHGPMLLYDLATGEVRDEIGADLPLATSAITSPRGKYAFTTDLRASGYLWKL